MISDTDTALLLQIGSIFRGQDLHARFSTGDSFVDSRFLALDLINLIQDRDFKMDVLRGSRSWLIQQKIFGSMGLDNKDSLRYVRSYPSQIGQKVLKSVIMANRHLALGEYLRAATNIIELNGVYPFVDLPDRASLHRRVNEGLLRKQEYGLAKEVARSVHNSLGNARYTRLAFDYPDILRRIGLITKEVSLLQVAVEVYETLPKGGQLRKEKIEKTSRLIARQKICG